MEYISKESILQQEKVCKEYTREEYKKLLELFSDNVRLVSYIVKQFKYPTDNSVDLEDVYQEAYLALWESCINFDDSRGFKFSTYSVSYIRGRILNMLRNTHEMKLPRKFLDISSAINKLDLSEPLDEESVDLLVGEGFQRNDIYAYSGFTVYSLDHRVVIGDDKPLADFIRDIGVNIGEDFTEEEIDELVTYLLSLISHMKNKEVVEDYIYSCFYEDDSITQKALSSKYNISQASVNRILMKSRYVFEKHKSEIMERLGL